MTEEIDKLMFLKRLTIVFLVLACVVVAIVVTLLIVMSTGDYAGANSDFARLEDHGEVETRQIDLGKTNVMYFFCDRLEGERTLFTGQIPNLKIVNSDKYTMEITANKTLLDKLRVETMDEKTTVSFKNNYYNSVLNGKRAYKGLYVDCDVFDVVVYAPISALASSAEFNLDFDTPKTDFLELSVWGEIRKGNVYNVDTEMLLCDVCGQSNVTLNGQVRYAARFETNHNSKVDARQLSVPKVEAFANCQLFGFSYIKGATFSEYSIMDIGFILSLGIIIMLIISVAGFVFFKIMLKKQEQKLDKEIEKIETEGNFLIKPEKTEENLLQNNE